MRNNIRQSFFKYSEDLLKYQYHEQISEEVRRQITKTEPRDEEMDEPPPHVMDELMQAI